MTRPGTFPCCSFSRWAESFLDGELSPEHTVDFENHLPDCELCNTKLKFERAVRLSTQHAVRSTCTVTQDFEARLRQRLAQERAGDDSKQAFAKHTLQSQQPGATVTPLSYGSAQSLPELSRKSRQQAAQHRPLSWRAIAPLSVAAAAALTFGAMRGESSSSVGLGAGQLIAGATGSEASRTDTMQTLREFLDQLAADSEHAQDIIPAARHYIPFPYRVHSNWPSMLPNAMAAQATADAANEFASINVINGQRIRPPHLDKAGAIWEGFHERQIPVQGRISSWHYRMANHRVLLWVYDSKKLPLRAVLEPRVAQNQAVFVGTHRGRAVAALEKNGFGYAATTDLPQAQAAELVATLGNEVLSR